MSWQFWLLPHCLPLRRPAGRKSSKAHHPLPRRPPTLAAQLLRRIRSFPLCRQRTRCDALRTSTPRGRAIA